MMLVKKGGVEVQGQKEYFCPHHPEVVQDKPGTCPKCGMELEEREKKAAEARTIYVCDSHKESVSETPGKCFKGT